MKKYFLIAILAVMPFLLFSQSGKFAAATTSQIAAAKTKQTTQKKVIKAGQARESRAPELTEYIYEDKEGNQYQVFRGSRGGYFYLKYSEITGKEEKRYIKIEK